MYLFTLALAAEPSGLINVPGPAAGLINLLPMVAIFLVFYFLLIRPQMRKQKDLQSMVSGLKKGDKVVAAGGIIGKIIKIEDSTISLEIDSNSKIQVVKGSVTELVDKKVPEKTEKK